MKKIILTLMMIILTNQAYASSSYTVKRNTAGDIGAAIGQSFSQSFNDSFQREMQYQRELQYQRDMMQLMREQIQWEMEQQQLRGY